jgi:hypothetical protein
MPISSLPEEEQKQQFSFAYVRAVGAVAGVEVEQRSIDRHSVDLQVEASGGAFPSLGIQVKCTSTNCIRAGAVHYPLKKKNYEDLRVTGLITPRILVVVVVPPDLNQWTSQNEQALVMRRCGYWMSLEGEPITKNKTVVTVHIPTAQVFTPRALRDILNTIDARWAST